MKTKAFIDELKSKGVMVKNGTNHCKLFYGDKWTTCRRHPSQEISNDMALKIKKQLGLG